jgi:hypothetical protein
MALIHLCLKTSAWITVGAHRAQGFNALIQQGTLIQTIHTVASRTSGRYAVIA